MCETDKGPKVNVNVELPEKDAKVLYSRLDTALAAHKRNWIVPVIERDVALAFLAGLSEALFP